MRSDHSTEARPSRRTRASSRDTKPRHHFTIASFCSGRAEPVAPSPATNSLCPRLRAEKPNLLGPAACLRESARPHLGGLVIGHVHHGEPAQPLLGLDVRSV